MLGEHACRPWHPPPAPCQQLLRMADPSVQPHSLWTIDYDRGLAGHWAETRSPDLHRRSCNPPPCTPAIACSLASN